MLEQQKTVLVTGCFGFIGSNLTIRLLSEGYKVIGIDNLTNPSIKPPDRIKASVGSKWPNFTFYKLDIRDLGSMLTVLKEYKIDRIAHLAAKGSVPNSFLKPSEYISVNEIGFVNILELAVRLNINQVVYASSSSVYGSNNRLYKVEGEEGMAISPYAQTKKHNEEMAYILGKAMGIDTIGLRFFNVYGPGQRHDSAYSAVIPKFIHCNEPMIYGDGKTIRDFTYVDDVCDAIIGSFECRGSFVANVGTGEGTSLNQLVDAMGKAENTKYAPERAGDIKISIADPTYSEARIGFKAKTSLPAGLARTISYYESIRAPTLEETL